MRITVVGALVGIVAAFSVAGVRIEWSPFVIVANPHWSLVNIASDLVQAYAILGGLVVQVIALVALVFTPGRMDVGKVKRVAASLDQMQQQLLALFGIYIATLVCALACKINIDPKEPPK